MEFESAKKIAEESGSNFLSSFYFLPKEKAQAMQVIYAFCRVTDDIVDQNSTEEISSTKKKLDNWRKETLKALRSDSENPLLMELKSVAEQYKIPEEHFLELIDGVEMDCTKTSYKTFEELYPYCYKVASVVGLISLQIFGCEEPRSKDYAIYLGVAFQLTNILRDILTDAQRGRVYLPEEDLAKFSLTRENFLSFCSACQTDGVILNSPALSEMNVFQNLILYECQRADHFYKKAKENLVSSDRSNLVAAEVMCAIYSAILKKIKKNPLSVFNGKVRLSKLKLYLCVLFAFLFNRLKI